MTNFKIGDCVVAKNIDGPKMTVDKIKILPITEKEEIVCFWFDKNDQKQIDSFSPEALRLCGDEASYDPIYKG